MRPVTTRPRAVPTLYIAFELGNTEWKLAMTTGIDQAPVVRTMTARALKTLEAEITRAKLHFGLRVTAVVRSCYEAGRDGFWLHRYLLSRGVQPYQSHQGAARQSGGPVGADWSAANARANGSAVGWERAPAAPLLSPRARVGGGARLHAAHPRPQEGAPRLVEDDGRSRHRPGALIAITVDAVPELRADGVSDCINPSLIALPSALWWREKLRASPPASFEVKLILPK